MASSKEGKGLNALGVAPYSVESERGGNDSMGVLGQTRPTGILVRSEYGRKPSLERVKERKGGGR